MATTPVIPTSNSAPPTSSPSAYQVLSDASAGVVDSFKSDSSGSQADETVAEPVTPPTGTESAQPDAQTSVNADTTAQAQAEPNPYDDPAPDTDVPQATLDVILKTPRGQEIYQGYKTLRELGKPVDQGGIGHVPTADQAKNYFLAYKDRVMMDGDLNSGNPQQIGRMLNHVFDPQRGQANIPIAQSLATSLANQPELYAAALEPFLKHYQSSIMERFAEAKTDDVKDALWLAAQILNKDLNGEYMPSPNGNGTVPSNGAVNGHANVPDPLARERADIQRERQELDQARQQSFQAQSKAWANSYGGEVQRTLLGEIDKALAPVKSMHSKAPILYEGLRDKFHDTVVNMIHSDTTAMELFGVAQREAQRAGSAQSAQALAKRYMDMAIPKIRAARLDFLNKAGWVAQQRNDNTHSELATIDSNRTAGGGNGSSPSPSNGAAITRGKEETHGDFILRMTRAATSGAAKRLK